MKKLKTVAVSLLALVMLLVGCNTSSGSGTLKVGVRDDIVGLGYLNPTTDKYYGMEIDLAELMAEKLGYEDVEYVTVNPDNRKQMLLDGEIDCLIAAYSISESRQENFDFSPAYYTDYSRVMVEQSSGFTQIKELMGKRIGTLDGANTAPVFALKMRELGLVEFEGDFVDVDAFDAVEFVKLASYDELSKALEEGTVDAACMDGCIASAYMNDNRMLFEDNIHQEEYGVATQKDSKISKPVAEAIQKMLDDGTINKLIDKWD